MNNEIADLQWDRDRHIAANAVLKAEVERRGERIAALESEIAEFKRYQRAVEWCEKYWANVEFEYKHCEIARLEPGQKEDRLFRGSTFLEAAERAMEAPPFTGESVPERRSRIAELEAENATLREDKARLVEALKKAVDVYGKPGGPWNVPGEPGTWIEQARSALDAARKEAPGDKAQGD